VKLVFVYNANEGKMAAFMDSVHKIVSPSTYACDLCAITYGITKIDKQWKAWLDALPVPTRFYHRPDFQRDWPHVTEPLPAIFVERDGALETLVSAADFKGVKHVDGLIAMLESRMGDL
jgi:hypothetical protein